MSHELNQDELNGLADLLIISQKAKAPEALCIKIGISYYKELGFIYESSEHSFAINLISHLNDVGNTKAICQLCCKELVPIFKGGKRESILKEIAVKLNCNQEHRHNYQNPSIVELPTSPTPSPVPPLQSDGSKSQSKKLYWLTGGAIILMGLAGFSIMQSNTTPGNHLEDVRIATDTANIVGKWKSAGEYGVSFKSDFSGDWVRGNTLGEIKRWNYNSETRELIFNYNYLYNSNPINGTAKLTLSEDGKTLNGTWKQGNDSGNWEMYRVPSQ